MIYVFLGNEINIIKKKIDSLIDELKIDNVIKYDYDSVHIDDILNEINYVDLFNEKKLLIVSNFTFKKMKDKEEKALSNYINHMNDNVIILKCIDEKLDNKKELIKLVNDKCKVIELKKMDYKTLHEYVTKIFSDNNKRITYNQIKNILSLCENDTDSVLNEVNKLLLYKMDSDTITDEDIENVISKNSEKEMFKLNDAVMAHNIPNMLESTKTLVSSGVDEVVIIDYLSKQFRTLYQIKVMSKDTGIQTITSRLSLNPFVTKKMLDVVGKFSEEKLLNIIYKLSDADISIKVEGLDKSKVLENFYLSI